MMKRILALFLACALLLPAAFAAAEELDFTMEPQQESISDEEILLLLYHTHEESDLLSHRLDEQHKTVTVLTHYSLNAYKPYFEQLLGGEMVQIICGAQEYSSKLANLVASGQIPDLVVSESSTNPTFVTLANAGLVQPFDDYIDYSVAELADLQPFYEAGLWNGQHYLAPFDNKPLYYLVYNPAIFEEYGLETPWELWEKGEWTWDAFRDAAQRLNVIDGDGNYICYGTSAPSYGAFSGATGVDYMQLGNGTLTLNLNDPGITRAENFINDMLFKDDIIKIKAQNSWSSYWTRGMLGMQIIDSWMLDGNGDITAAIRAGRCMVAPLPQDPQNNVPGEYRTYAQSGGFCLVNGAQNPEGAAMFIRMLAYVNRYFVSLDGETEQEALAKKHEAGETNQFLYQRQVSRDISHATVSFGYAFMAQHGIWGFMVQQNNWTSFVESILPKAQESIREMLGE